MLQPVSTAGLCAAHRVGFRWAGAIIIGEVPSSPGPQFAAFLILKLNHGFYQQLVRIYGSFRNELSPLLL